ncbi:MAG: dihydrofolate reductase [Gammaproteobacteria bacterium]|nr:dihydrofolate reductase [Gammaproteobacteria bacterium]
MNELVLVAALAKNRVIGIDNKLPWRLPDDLKHFKKLTLGHSIVMGRKTWESLPGVLPDRHHIVITRDLDYPSANAQIVHSIEQAISLVPEEEPVFIVGGANLYQQLLHQADRMELTLVDAEPEGDAFFPEWDTQQWQEVTREHHAADDRHKFAFDFIRLQRIQ